MNFSFMDMILLHSSQQHVSATSRGRLQGGEKETQI
jgi:hypothetical protein